MHVYHADIKAYNILPYPTKLRYMVEWWVLTYLVSHKASNYTMSQHVHVAMQSFICTLATSVHQLLLAMQSLCIDIRAFDATCIVAQQYCPAEGAISVAGSPCEADA